MATSQIFPKWTNKIPLFAAAGVVGVLVSLIAFFWYYGSPKYTDVGYQPQQPVEYSHKLHAGDLGIDCRYCHTSVEESGEAIIPPTQTCMNCHALIKPESEKLKLIRESWQNDTAIEWIRIHKTPDYAYFNHSAHINQGVGCASCHGPVDQMEVVYQAESLSMGWCLECHRNPEMHLRPLDQVTNMAWEPDESQFEIGTRFIDERNITPPTDCSGCHR